MSYTITLTSDNEYIASSSYLTLEIIFTIDATASNESYDFSDKNIIVTKWGSTKWTYDLEKAFLLPGSMKMEFSDIDLYLHDLLFDNANSEKTPKFTLSLNGTTKFIGYVIEDEIIYNYANRLLTVTVVPRLDIINKQMVYDTDDEPTDPFDYDGGNYRLFYTILEDIFQLVNSGITLASGNLSLQQNWTFAGYIKFWAAISNATHSAGAVTVTVADTSGMINGDMVRIIEVVGMTDLNGDFEVSNVQPTTFDVTLTTAQTYTSGGQYSAYETATIDEIYQLEDPLYFDSAQGIRTCGDILRRLALDWCCYCGMVHEEKAFFRKLFYYDDSNTQSLGEVENIIKSYKVGLIDYVTITTTVDAGKTYTAGTFTELEDRYIERADILPAFYDSIPDGEAGGGTNIKANPSGTLRFVIWAKDTDIDSDWHDNGYLIANFWYNFRGNINNCRIDKFENILGVGYDPLKNFTYDSFKYQPINTEIFWSENRTTIEAINLGSA